MSENKDRNSKVTAIISELDGLYDKLRANVEQLNMMILAHSGPDGPQDSAELEPA